MILTREAIDTLCPEHGRTSCSDDDPCNGYGGWYGGYYNRTGGKEIVWPRCNRCYLLAHVGEQIESLEFRPDVTLDWVESNCVKR